MKYGMMLTIYVLGTCIANSRFIWQPLKAPPMALQPVLTKSKPSQPVLSLSYQNRTDLCVRVNSSKTLFLHVFRV